MTPPTEALKSKSPLDHLNGLVSDSLKSVKDSIDRRGKIGVHDDLVKVKGEAEKKYEAPKETWTKNFELGKYLIGAKDKAPEIKDKSVYLLMGSVDRVAYDKDKIREKVMVYKKDNGDPDPDKWPDVNWYEDIKNNAQTFMKFKDRVDINFPSLKDTAKKDNMYKIVEAMSKMPTFTDASWKKMIADNKFSDDDVYGPEGAFNLILAFSRATGNVDLEKDSKVAVGKDQNNKDITVDKLYKIHLEVSSKAGNRPVNRYGKVVEIGVK